MTMISEFLWRKSPRPLRLGIVGATGLVGQSFLQVLSETPWEIEELRVFASDQSLGKVLSWQGRQFPLRSTSESFRGLDALLICTGDEVSQQISPRAVSEGVWVIDNSSAFRLHPEVPLVVPELGTFSEALLSSGARILSNPNCSTIQLVVLLSVLQKCAQIESVQVASYQAVSGAGSLALEEFQSQIRAFCAGQELAPARELPATIFSNCIPQIGNFDGEALSREEQKIRKETQKILGLSCPVSVFAVRVPVHNAHAEAVWVTSSHPWDLPQIHRQLQLSPGLHPVETYPLQASCSGKDGVFVGRVHLDPDEPRILKAWIVADNLRKGAASNALQILQELFPAIDPDSFG